MSENQNDRALDYAEIEKELAAFEAEERKRLGIEEEKVEHWHDANPQNFTRDEREHTTVGDPSRRHHQTRAVTERSRPGAEVRGLAAAAE